QLGEVEAGIVAKAIGPQASVSSGGILCVGAAAIVAVFVPSGRRYRAGEGALPGSSLAVPSKAPPPVSSSTQHCNLGARTFRSGGGTRFTPVPRQGLRQPWEVADLQTPAVGTRRALCIGACALFGPPLGARNRWSPDGRNTVPSPPSARPELLF